MTLSSRPKAAGANPAPATTAPGDYYLAFGVSLRGLPPFYPLPDHRGRGHGAVV